MRNTLVFTGSYTQPLLLGDGQMVEGGGDGICVFRMDETGGLRKLSSVEAPNPTYLALDKSGLYLYTVNELKEYGGAASSAVSAYETDAVSGALRFINRRLTGGEDACNLSLSPSGSHLMAANFSGGSLCVFPIEDGHGIGRPSCFLQHYGSGPDPARQGEPHVHQVIPDKAGTHVLVPDLGTDEVVVYDANWDKGHLSASKAGSIRTSPGAGPRLCVFDSTGTRLYLLTELGSAVCVYDYDGQSGTARLLQTISALPEGCGTANTAACIKLHPDGGLLYASNRGHDSIAAYRIDVDGLLTLLDIYPSGGRTPRDFDISPSGDFLIVGNQDSDELVVFAIERQSGALREVCREACGSVTAVLIADMGEL